MGGSKLSTLKDCSNHVSALLNSSEGNSTGIQMYTLEGKDSVTRVFGTYAKTDMINPKLQPVKKRGNECCRKESLPACLPVSPVLCG